MNPGSIKSTSLPPVATLFSKSGLIVNPGSTGSLSVSSAEPSTSEGASETDSSVELSVSSFSVKSSDTGSSVELPTSSLSVKPSDTILSIEPSELTVSLAVVSSDTL